MASVWITPRTTKSGEKRYRVEYRLGGRESGTRYGGSFGTKREATARKQWIAGELAAMRVPELRSLRRESTKSPMLGAMAEKWRASRIDVRTSTQIQHRTALARALPLLGKRPVTEISSADVAELVAKLSAEGKARESIRKTRTALAMVFDFAGVAPNPARDINVRLPRAEPAEPESPTADAVERVAWLLTPKYRLALLVLDATGCRVGELEAARLGDVDESRRGWLVRAAVSKTRRPRWVVPPDDLWGAISKQLPPREDRAATAPLFPGVTQERLRTAIGRACRDAGVPHFSPHSLRHRRISLLHRAGHSWAEIGDLVGQRSKIITADRYSHALPDYREVDRPQLLGSRT